MNVDRELEEAEQLSSGVPALGIGERERKGAMGERRLIRSSQRGGAPEGNVVPGNEISGRKRLRYVTYQ